MHVYFVLVVIVPDARTMELRFNGRCIYSIISNFDCFIIILQQQMKCMQRDESTPSFCYSCYMLLQLLLLLLFPNFGPIILPSLCLLHDCILQTFLFPSNFIRMYLLAFILFKYCYFALCTFPIFHLLNRSSLVLTHTYTRALSFSLILIRFHLAISVVTCKIRYIFFFGALHSVCCYILYALSFLDGVLVSHITSCMCI